MHRHRLVCTFGRRFYHLKAGSYYGYQGKREDFVKFDRPYPTVSESDQGLNALINAYRTHGYKAAKLDPLGLKNVEISTVPELDASNHGLIDCSQQCTVSQLMPSIGCSSLTVSSLVDDLQSIYCGPISAEYMHVSDWRERLWFGDQFEKLHSTALERQEKMKIAELMLKCQNFDHYLGLKFSTIKRYGGEGAESMMAFFWEIINNCPTHDISDVFVGMAHRGRLNLLTLILQFPPVQMFRKYISSVDLPVSGGSVHVSMLANPSHLEAINPVAVGKTRGRQQSLNCADYFTNSPPNDRALCIQVHGDGAFSGQMRGQLEFPPELKATGDVLSHFVSSVDLPVSGGSVHVSMLANPSHLEAINPVAVGKTRGRQQSLNCADYFTNSPPNDRALCIQVHGDGTFSGQGIVPETLALSQCPNFRVGGSVHLITNNQLGYTAQADIARSSRHTSDLAKAIDSPVIHVNGDYPELVSLASRLALSYRQTFSKDIFINLLCYRRWGHNEMDDPSFTQPIMYDVIGARQSTPDLYAKQLIDDGILTSEQKDAWIAEHNKEMAENFKIIDSTPPRAVHLTHQWKNMRPAPRSLETWDTGVDVGTLKYTAAKSVTAKEDMSVHDHLSKTHCSARLKRLEEGSVIDWSTAEAMAMGTLLLQGFSVRLSGQDVGRGTFSQRHAMLVDRKTDEAFVPLNNISKDQTAFLEVANSLLSEEAVLGFEYGMSVENPNRLVIWEAQFGDFFNGAQIIIDTFVTSGEDKWLQQSGLVMLLPHGYDGMGPEHSSSRPERWLQLSDSSQTHNDTQNVNFSIVHPTTAAQYFHLLRQQMVRPYRKPLVVFSPKLLLRHPSAASDLSQFAPGTHFKPVIADDNIPNDNITKLILCSGKHVYALQREREKRKLSSTCAIVRLEAICPFPAHQLKEQLDKYKAINKIVWSQEEPRNMGCWDFVSKRCEQILGIKMQYAGRPELPMVATAIGELHQKEIEQLMDMTFN